MSIRYCCRSPWSNKYFPEIEDGFMPSEKLREMEIEFNELFDAYRELYFEGGTSSVYLWDLDHGFAACFLIKKSKRRFIMSDAVFIHRCSVHQQPQTWKVIGMSRVAAGTRFTW